MKFSIILTLISILLTTCTVNKQLTTLDLEPDESIVAGHMKVLYNGEDITEETTLFFNEKTTGKYNYKTDTIGYIITKLPVGDCFISRIAYTNIFYNLPAEMTHFQISDRKRVNYIGDLTINWIGPKTKISGMFGLIGAIADEMNNDGELEIYVEDNQEEFRKYFYSHYDSDIEFNSIVLNLSHPDSLSQHNIFAKPSDNPNFLNFNIIKNKTCYGLLRMIKKKAIYVEQSKKLFVIRKKDLLSITDKDGNDVTEKTLNQTDFKKINFNNYEIIEF